MSDEETIADPGLDPTHLVLIVVGAHLRAEQADRALAYRLQAAIEGWIDAHQESLEEPITPMVCCDIWYLNHETLQARPTICIGGPGVNALSAYFGQQLDAATVADNEVIIQMDPEFVDLRACVWGMDHDMTSAAVEVFEQRYLDGFMRAVATQVEPEVE